MRKRIEVCEQILEEFRQILQLEKKAAETYHQLAQDCDHSEVSQVLERISREEVRHAELADRLVKTAEFYAKQIPAKEIEAND